jgi:hypothetical protein
MQLADVAKVVRSKNAGPRTLTFDLIFENAEDFERVRSITRKLHSEIARRYGKSVNQVTMIAYPPANAIKVSMRRSVMAGDPGDRDVYGAQQHAQLLDIEL